LRTDQGRRQTGCIFITDGSCPTGEKKRSSTAGPPNIRGVGAELPPRDALGQAKSSAYQLTSPLVCPQTHNGEPTTGNMGNPNRYKRENRLVSKWRSKQLPSITCLMATANLCNNEDTTAHHGRALLCYYPLHHES
jgi:hypothetical protein